MEMKSQQNGNNASSKTADCIGWKGALFLTVFMLVFVLLEVISWTSTRRDDEVSPWMDGMTKTKTGEHTSTDHNQKGLGKSSFEGRC